MKILKNKYFILGNIVLLLVAIPLTLLFLSRQQDIRSAAAPTTRITLNPTTLSFEGNQCSEQSISVRLDPGENIVSIVELFITYDSTTFNISISPNENVFPEILRGPTVSSGQASVVMDIGSNVANTIRVPVDIATLTIVPVAATEQGPTNISIDSSRTKVFSLSENDSTTENVFLSGGQAAINIDSSCINGQNQEVPTPTPSLPIGDNPPIPPLSSENESPVCTTLAASPSNVGTVPFILNLSAQGSDADGMISKATFNFGDNTIQDVFEGLATATVTAQLSHTYQTPGTYSASVVFTDNNGSVSPACTTNITVNPSEQQGIQPTSTPTPTPIIENPGGTETTLAVVGGLLLVILGGLALIAL